MTLQGLLFTGTQMVTQPESVPKKEMTNKFLFGFVAEFIVHHHIFKIIFIGNAKSNAKMILYCMI